MAADHSYHVMDEPRPGRLQRITVKPMWPMYAMMFAGTWFAWPWFLINGAAFGSPTLRQELRTVALGYAVTAALALLLLLLIDLEVITTILQVKLAALSIVIWKLGVSYRLLHLHERTFELYEYFGGKVVSGATALGVGIFLRPIVLDLVDSTLWKIIVSGLSWDSSRDWLNILTGGLWP